MTLPTYSKRVWSTFIALVLVAAPCAAHKVDSTDSQDSAQTQAFPSVAAMSNHYTQQYLRYGNDEVLDDFEKHLNAQVKNRQAASDKQYLLAKAWIAQARHQFDQALGTLDNITTEEPQNGQAWLTKANVLAVQGKKDAALDACNHVTAHLSLQTGLFCKARLAASPDEKSKAFRTVSTMIQQGLPQALQAWAHGIAAELAADLNLSKQAEQHFNASLDRFAAIQIRARYMDFLIHQQRYREALKVSKGSGNPALHVRELIARKEMKTHERALLERAIAHTHHQFMHWQKEADYQHAREMAMFYIDVMQKPKLALTLAEINLQNQREPEDLALVQRAQQMIKKENGTQS